MKLHRYFGLMLLPTVFLTAGGCFTGIEGTPRIGADTVRRQGASAVSAEHTFLDSITPSAPAEWQSGKRFLVANNRISLIFTPNSSKADNMSGNIIYFKDFRPSTTITGDDATEAVFTDGGDRTFIYRIPALGKEKLDTLSRLEIPFTVDLDLVDDINAVMSGRNFFITTPQWYDSATRARVDGLRQIEVTVDSVAPGDENFPAAVFFHPSDPVLRRKTDTVSSDRLVLMSIGNDRTATRNFDTMFSFKDPRKLYPEIKDDVWNLIVESRVREGMTPRECRLALGAPNDILRIPTTAGMRERWTYSDGIFLIFDDGYLTRFRL